MILLRYDWGRKRLAVHLPYRPVLLERIKRFPGRVWKNPFWLLPMTAENVAEVEETFKDLDEVTRDSSLTEVLEVQAKRAREVIDWKRATTAGAIPLAAATRFFTEPYQHQRTALGFLQQREAFALFMEMGTGKTKVVLDLLGNAYRNGDAQLPSLIVAPVSVIGNWVREAQRHQPGLNLVIGSGTPAQRKKARDLVLTHQAHGLVVNYEILWRDYEELKDHSWWSMVLDESTKIKHRATKQAKAVLKLGQWALRRYIMTGTPTPNNPLELFNQIRFLDPTVFGHSWYAFRDRYAVMGGYDHYQVIGWKNLPELSAKLASISYRVLKQDCLDLPPKLYKEYRLTMATAQAKAYKELAEHLVTELQGQQLVATVVLAQLTKLRQLASGFAYQTGSPVIRLADNPKLVALEEILATVVQEHKVVIWTSFKEELTAVRGLCERLKVPHVTLDGSTSLADRDLSVRRFQEEPAVRVFIGNQHAGGLGITLTAADYCVFYSNDYSHEIRAQAEDRLHRIGQKNTVTYVDLLMKGTIDVTIKNALTQKADLAARLVPGELRKAVLNDEG